MSEHLTAIYGDDFTISNDLALTTMCGIVKDPAQLHGIVIHLTALGLELRRIEPLSESLQLRPQAK